MRRVGGVKKRESGTGPRVATRSSEMDETHLLVSQCCRGQRCIRTETPANSQMP